MRSLALLLLVSFLLPLQAAVTADSPESQKLQAVFDKHWERELEQNPVRASYLGDKRYGDQWRDLSTAAVIKRRQGDAAALQDLAGIDRELLSAEDKLNYRLFERRYRDRIEASQFDTHLIPISHRGGIQTRNQLGDRISITSVEDFEAWLTRLKQMDEQMDQVIALMDEGIARGLVPPKILMKRVPAQIKRQLVEDPEESPFFSVFEQMPSRLDAETQSRLKQEARQVINKVVIPAYKKLDRYFAGTYMPAGRDSIAAIDRPNGKAYYEYLVRRFTTTNMTPDEVHELGKREVARNLEEMKAIMQEVEFEGDLKGFFTNLREDPKFYYDNPDDLFEGYLAISKRIDPELVNLFGKLPRMPYGLKKIPDEVAPDTTTAYYLRPAADGSRAGYYYVNLYEPSSRPKWEMEVLSVHEAVPGHHLQIALQQELEAMPNFRRYGGFTAFTEGWGLYSERLGYDLGMYQDPYSKFGQLTYDMWRAVRLVVDTGMHYKGWTRQEAIDYFMAHAPKSKLDITNEIDRYIGNPGQALAYKLGQLKLLELRARAEKALGDDFDIRAFHDEVLSYGAVPLAVLEEIVDEWIASQRGESRVPE